MSSEDLNAAQVNLAKTADEQLDDRERWHEERIAELFVKGARWLLAAVLLASFVLGWVFRWQPIEVHPAVGRGSIYLMHRWTGEVRLVSDEASTLVTKEK